MSDPYELHVEEEILAQAEEREYWENQGSEWDDLYDEQ